MREWGDTSETSSKIGDFSRENVSRVSSLKLDHRPYAYGHFGKVERSLEGQEESEGQVFAVLRRLFSRKRN